MLRDAPRVLAPVIPALVVAAFLRNYHVATPLKVEAVLFLILSLVQPAFGLLLVAFFVPLGDIAMPLLGASPVRHAETVIAAFLAGWLVARAAERGHRPWRMSGPPALAAWTFACVVVVSAVVTALQFQRASPSVFQAAATSIVRSYLVTDEPMGAHAAGGLLEGIGLVVAAAELSRRKTWLRFWLPAALVASGIVISAASGLLAIGIGTAATLAHHAAADLPRYSAAQPDVNAAGSLLVLLIGIAVGLGVHGRRSRVLGAGAAVLLAGAMVLAGSKAAFGAAAIVLCAVAAIRLLRSAPARVTLPAAAIAVAAAGAFLARTPGAAASMEMRYGFTQSSIRMIDARPLLGVGVGRYYATSSLTFPPSLAWFYGRENAHDYFLQIAAELGLAGLVAFAWLLISCGWRAGAAAIGAAAPALTIGCLAGLAAYLVTCATGHPFLVPEAAIPFWIALGVVAGFGAEPAFSSRNARLTACAIGIVLVATIPFRLQVTAVRLPVGNGADGFVSWDADEPGFNIRAMRTFASLFFVPSVSEVQIPLRAPAAAPGQVVNVDLATPGSPPSRVLVGREWSAASIALPPPDPLLPRARVNLVVERGAGAPGGGPILVGQPRIRSTR